MAEEKEEATGTTAAAAPAGGSKLVMIASVGNAVATLAVIGLLFMSHQKEKSKPGVEDIVAGEKSGHGGGDHGGGGHGEKKDDGHGGGHGGGGAAEPSVTDSGKMIPLDPFTVNLSSGSVTSPRYVRMNISVELEQGVSDQEFTVKLPRVRDTVINLLNSKKASEVSAPEGRDLLKDEIKKSVNSFMLQSKVKGVYFTNFAISQ